MMLKLLVANLATAVGVPMADATDFLHARWSRTPYFNKCIYTKRHGKSYDPRLRL